eukprot:SAG22_NODE_20675_length_263_cov_1.560976_1_plen_62_part_10
MSVCCGGNVPADRTFARLLTDPRRSSLLPQGAGGSTAIAMAAEQGKKFLEQEVARAEASKAS